MTYKRLVASGAAATIKAGEPTKESSTWDGNVAIMADGDGLTDDTKRFAGLAKNTSTDTVAAAGEVVLYIPFPGLIYSGKPKVAGAADTQAEIDALIGKRIPFDVTSSAWTLDAAASDSVNNSVVIIGGQASSDRLWFVVSATTVQYFENN